MASDSDFGSRYFATMLIKKFLSANDSKWQCGFFQKTRLAKSFTCIHAHSCTICSLVCIIVNAIKKP